MIQNKWFLMVLCFYMGLLCLRSQNWSQFCSLYGSTLSKVAKRVSSLLLYGSIWSNVTKRLSSWLFYGSTLSTVAKRVSMLRPQMTPTRPTRHQKTGQPRPRQTSNMPLTPAPRPKAQPTNQPTNQRSRVVVSRRGGR